MKFQKMKRERERERERARERERERERASVNGQASYYMSQLSLPDNFLFLIISKSILSGLHISFYMQAWCRNFFLWVCHLRLSQREGDPVVGWLNHKKAREHRSLPKVPTSYLDFEQGHQSHEYNSANQKLLFDQWTLNTSHLKLLLSVVLQLRSLEPQNTPQIYEK